MTYANLIFSGRKGEIPIYERLKSDLWRKLAAHFCHPSFSPWFNKNTHSLREIMILSRRKRTTDLCRLSQNSPLWANTLVLLNENKERGRKENQTLCFFRYKILKRVIIYKYFPLIETHFVSFLLSSHLVLVLLCRSFWGEWYFSTATFALQNKNMYSFFSLFLFTLMVLYGFHQPQVLRDAIYLLILHSSGPIG